MANVLECPVAESSRGRSHFPSVLLTPFQVYCSWMLREFDRIDAAGPRSRRFCLCGGLIAIIISIIVLSLPGRFILLLFLLLASTAVAARRFIVSSATTSAPLLWLCCLLLRCWRLRLRLLGRLLLLRLWRLLLLLLLLLLLRRRCIISLLLSC